jgi:peptidoglycan hydrolase-like protein with peptidoglycan-binding domain
VIQYTCYPTLIILMKKYILAAAFSLFLLSSPLATHAASLTSSQISAIVSLLQSFGADSATIANVQTSLSGGTSATGGGQAFCYKFNTNLTVGSSGADVVALREALSRDGIAPFTTLNDTPVFDENTAGAVVRFQAKYGIRQTGYVGPITRAKLNELYGCGTPTAGISFSLSHASVVRNQSYKFVGNISGAPANSPIVFHLQRPDGSTYYNAQTNYSTDSDGNAVVSYPVTIGNTGQDGPWTAIVNVDGRYSNRVSVRVSSAVTQPSITAISPSSGPTGTTVTINGSGFNSGDIVYFNRQPVSATSHRESPDPSIITRWSFVVPSNAYSSSCGPAMQGVTCEVKVARGPYIVNDGGSNTSFYVTGSVTTTSASAPTIEFIGTPTLSLQTDSAGKEAYLVGKATVKVTAGNVSVNQQTQQNLPYILYFYRTGSGDIGNYGPTGSNSMRRVVAPEIAGMGCSGLPGGAILPNTSCTFTITNMVPTREIFAGAYTLSLSGFGYPDANGNWQTLQPSSFQNISTDPNGLIIGVGRVTIIGETSPYITSAWSDLAGNAAMKGVRFGNSGSNVATTIMLDGKTISSGANTNNGYYIVNYVDGVGYINFRPSDFGITTSGNYRVQIINSSLGNSNITYLNYTATGTTQPSITVLSPNGGETLIAGNPYTIRWNASNFPSNATAHIVLRTLFGIPDTNIGLAASTVGNYTWQIPANSTPGQYEIAVYQADLTGAIGPNGVKDKSDAPFNIVTATTPITLSSISPASGPVGTNIRLDGCGSDSSSGFTLVYSGPKSGTAAIPVETLGAASGCGYMTIAVPSDFPAGTYTLSVKNNQTGAMSTNSMAFTVLPLGCTSTSGFSSVNGSACDGSISTAPAISYITPSQGTTNDTITIYGTNLSDGRPSVEFYSSSNGSLVATVPFVSLGLISSQSIVIPIANTSITTGGMYQIKVITSAGRSNGASFVLTVVTTSTPITLTNITPASGPVGTNIRLDGCGSDSSSGFTLVYSGPKSGTAVIPIETLGATSGCGYMTIAVPTDFPTGTYSLSVKNNQTGAMSTNSMAFTVTSNYYPATLSVYPTSFVAGAPATITVANAGPNATIKVFCRDPNNVVCDDSATYTTDASGRFTHTYNTTGWTVGTYRAWVTGNISSPFWSWRSVDIGFTVTAPATTVQTIVISRTPQASLAAPYKVGDATVSSSVNTPSLFTSNLTGTGYNQIGTNAPHIFSFTTFDLVNSGACNAQTGVCNIPGNWDAASFLCPAGLGIGTTQYMTEWYTIGNVTSNKIGWFFRCSGTVTASAYSNPNLASALSAFNGATVATNTAPQSTNNFTYVWNRDLQIGSPYLDDVTALQKALTLEGVYGGEITGGFYNQTYLAVKAFQQRYAIEATGFVGSLTRAKLNTLFAQ